MGSLPVVLTQNTVPSITVPSIIDGKSHRVALLYSIYQGDSCQSISDFAKQLSAGSIDNHHPVLTGIR
jgi:hypothetical protein